MKSFQKHLTKQKHFSREYDEFAGATTFFGDNGMIGYAERACTKKRHRTYKKAMTHIRILVDSGETKQGDMHPYLCSECHFYHIGHKL